MFFQKSKKKYSYFTLGLFFCAFLLVGLGYAFVQNLEKIYEEQARVTLNAVSANVAHFYDYNLDDALGYAEALAHNYTLHEKNAPKQSIDATLATLNKPSDKFPFMGIITHDATLHLVAQQGHKVEIDSVTINRLLLPPLNKNIYALAYMDDKGEHYSFYTKPITLAHGEEALFFVAKSYSSLNQSLMPTQLPSYIRYMIVNPQAQIAEGTFPYMTLGENMLDVLGSEPKNSAEVLRSLRDTVSLADSGFAKVYINNNAYYVSLTPTQQKEWIVGVFVSYNTVQNRLEKVIYVLMTIGATWFIFCVITLLHVVKTQWQAKKNSQDAAKRLQWLFDQSPSGVVRFNDDAQWTVLDYGNSFLSTIGITAKELRTTYNNSWAELIHPQDLDAIKQSLAETIEQGEDLAILEYRLKSQGQDPIWILENVRIINDESGRWFWSTLINISERKNQELRDQNMTVRYRYLFEASENILYEYNWNTQKLRTTVQFFKKFGYPLPAEKSDYYTVDLDIIHPEDMDLFQSMQAKLQTGGTAIESLLRLKNANGSWIWCQLRQNSWQDMTTNETKVIGEIKNVDEETRCLQKLRDDVQRDAFTGLYNKTASTEIIQQAVLNNQGERGVLCIIDVDNFKNVNDNLGHAVGDIVIKNLASGLASIFRSDDIVGRMGGDEYIVYLKNMPNLGVLLVKLDKVIEFFKQKLEGEGVVVNISCSIGIALFPTDADNYEDLYTRADKALYRSKKKKGIYTFYDAKIDG